MQRVNPARLLRQIAFLSLGLVLILQSLTLSRVASAQSQDPAVVSVTADTHVLNINRGDQATLTATFTQGGVPLVGYTVLMVNGTQLFPDGGKVNKLQGVTDSDGQATFIYTPDHNEDIVDISVIGLLSQDPARVAEIKNSGVIDPGEAVAAGLQLVKDDPGSYGNLSVERLKADLLASEAEANVAAATGGDIPLAQVDIDSNKVLDTFDSQLNRLTTTDKAKVLVSLNTNTAPDQLTQLGLKSITSRIYSGSLSKTDIYALAKNPSVLIIEDDQAIYGAQLAEGNAGDAADVKILQAAGAGAGNITVMDTGVDPTYALIGADRIAGWFDAVNGRNDPYDDGVDTAIGKHGTKVSATSLENAPAGTGIVGVKVLDAQGKGDESQLLTGLTWLDNNTASLNSHIVNLSLIDYGYSPATKQVITDLISKGMIIVAAAGNNNGGAVNYPAAYPGVISVGATDSATGQLADFSAKGSNLDLATNGVNVSFQKGGQTFDIGSGTSFAAPAIAGMIAEANCTSAADCITELKASDSQVVDGATASANAGTSGSSVGTPTPGSPSGSTGASVSVTSSAGANGAIHLAISANHPNSTGTMCLVYSFTTQPDNNPDAITIKPAGGRCIGASLPNAAATAQLQGSLSNAEVIFNSPTMQRTIVVTVQMYQLSQSFGSVPQSVAQNQVTLTEEGPTQDQLDQQNQDSTPSITFETPNPASVPANFKGEVQLSGTATVGSGNVTSISFDDGGAGGSFSRSSTTASQSKGAWTNGYQPPSGATGSITLTATAHTSGGQTASQSAEITFASSDNPSDNGAGDQSAGEGLSNQTGDVKIDVTKSGDNANGSGYKLAITTNYVGKAVDTNLKANISGGFGTVSDPAGSAGHYTVTYFPSQSAVNQRAIALITFSASYINTDGATKTGSADYSISLATTNPGSSDVSRGLSLSATTTDMSQPAAGFSFGKSRSAGGLTFFDTINDLTTDHVNPKFYTVLHAELHDGNGAPIANAPITFTIKSGGASSGSWSGYLATETYQGGRFVPASGPIQGSTNDAGVVEAYYVLGEYTKGSVVIEASNVSLANTPPADVTLTISSTDSSAGTNQTPGGGADKPNKNDPAGDLGISVTPTTNPLKFDAGKAGQATDVQTLNVKVTGQNLQAQSNITLSCVAKADGVSITDCSGTGGTQTYPITGSNTSTGQHGYTIKYLDGGQKYAKGTVTFTVSGADKNGKPISHDPLVVSTCLGDACTAGGSGNGGDNGGNSGGDNNPPSGNNDPNNLTKFNANIASEVHDNNGTPYQNGSVTISMQAASKYAKAKGNDQIFISVKSSDFKVSKGTTPSSQDASSFFSPAASPDQAFLDFTVTPKSGTTLSSGKVTISVSAYEDTPQGPKAVSSSTDLSVAGGQSQQQQDQQQANANKQKTLDAAVATVSLSPSSGSTGKVVLSFNPGSFSQQGVCLSSVTAVAKSTSSGSDAVTPKFQPGAKSSVNLFVLGNSSQGNTITNSATLEVTGTTDQGKYTISINVGLANLTSMGGFCTDSPTFGTTSKNYDYSYSFNSIGGGQGGSAGGDGSNFTFDPNKSLDTLNYTATLDQLNQTFQRSSWLSSSFKTAITSEVNRLKTQTDGHVAFIKQLKDVFGSGDTASTANYNKMLNVVQTDPSTRPLIDAIADIQLTAARQRLRKDTSISGVESDHNQREFDQLAEYFETTRDPKALQQMYEIDFTLGAFAQNISDIYTGFGLSQYAISPGLSEAPTGTSGFLNQFLAFFTPNSTAGVVGGANASTGNSQAQSISIWQSFLNWIGGIFHGGQ